MNNDLFIIFVHIGLVGILGLLMVYFFYRLADYIYHERKFIFFCGILQAISLITEIVRFNFTFPNFVADLLYGITLVNWVVSLLCIYKLYLNDRDGELTKKAFKVYLWSFFFIFNSVVAYLLYYFAIDISGYYSATANFMVFVVLKTAIMLAAYIILYVQERRKYC